MLEQLKTMEGNLARYDLFTSTTIPEYFDGCKLFMEISCRLSKGDLRLPVHRMELGRIRFPAGFFLEDCDCAFRFVINSYLRARLQKIESQIWHYTGPGEAGSRMTQV